MGYSLNTDATDFVLPNAERQEQCIHLALQRAGITPEQVDVVSTHATGTVSGDSQECVALRRVFQASERTFFNNTKSFIGHTMGAAGALELAGNLVGFTDGTCHATINVDELDPECELKGLVLNQPRELKGQQIILNNSFGMLGINSAVIIKKV
jgi:3-oxoacyl-[acyl-carrier-protein] synthase II